MPGEEGGVDVITLAMTDAQMFAMVIIAVMRAELTGCEHCEVVACQWAQAYRVMIAHRVVGDLNGQGNRL